MNLQKIIGFILLLSVFFTNCDSNISKKKTPAPDTAVREIYGRESANPETTSIKIFKKNEIVLDTGEDIIGFVMDIKIEGDNILVIDPIYSKKGFYFTNKGKLLFTLGRHGEGPGEVPMLCAACMTGERIFVFGNYRLIIYDRKTGTLIKTMKKPFRSICNSVYPASDGTIFALSYNRYNKNKDTIYHLDKNGNLVNSFSEAGNVPGVFDTYFPQTGLFTGKEKIYQFFNFKYEISVYDYNGKKIENVKLNSRLYTEPDLKEARSVKRRDEKKFRATFTQVSGFYKYSNGFISVLTNWKDIKTSHTILEFWTSEFIRVGSCNFDKTEDLVHFHDDYLLTIDSDQYGQKLEFWEIVFQSEKQRNSELNFNKEQKNENN